jgi:hypothetical protein
MANTVLVKNLAVSGSGIYSNVCDLNIAYTTVAANRDGWGDGIGLYLRDPVGSDAVYTIENAIIVQQTIGLFVESGDASMEATFWGDGDWVNDSDTGGTGTINPGTLIYQGVPDFVDADDNDYHLDENSPAIDKGIDTWVTHDMDNQHRPAGESDIGADEYGQMLFVYLPLVIR